MSKSSLSDETGNASLEFITAGLILLLPLVYLIMTMSVIQSASLAVEGASRQAVRVYVQAPDESDAREEAQRAVQFALADYGIKPDSAVVAISCSPRPAKCLTRRASVTIDVSVAVSLPLMPDVITAHLPPQVQLRSRATQQVSRFWSGS